MFYAVLIVVLLAPIPLGSNRPRFWFSLESTLFALFAIFCLSRLVSGKSRAAHKNRTIIALLLVWTAYLVLQLVPLPGWMLGTISPTALEISKLAQADAALFSITLQAFSTFEELLKRIMYVCVFVMFLYLLHRRGQLKLAVYAVIVFGLLQCAYTYVGYSLDPEGHLKGTFTNKNHFALYVAVALSLTIGVYLANLNRQSRFGLASFLSGANVVAFGLVLVLVTILLFSQSKGAVLSFSTGVFATYFYLRIGGKTAADGDKHSSIFWLIFGAAGVSAIWVGAGGIASRFTLDKITGDERVLQWGDSLALVKDYWLTGSGAGTYVHVFPTYKTYEYRPLLYDHVHNDYLEAWCNEGIIGLAIMLAIFLMWLLVMKKEYKSRRDPFIRGMTFGIVLAVVTIMLHGFVDYNLQVPANILTLFALMGIGLAAVRIDKTRRHRSAEV